MLNSSLEFLRCVQCGSKLELESFKENGEIVEGILHCKKCHLKFPIIEKIPILWDDLSKYLSSRKILGGYLYKSVSSPNLKQLLKHSLSETVRTDDDRTRLEERWSKIYLNSKNSKFYFILKNSLDSLPTSKFVLEHGCSIGIMSSHLSEKHEKVFGIDRSYSAIQQAKKPSKENLDYFVADSMSSIFGKQKFDLVLALNILELIEPLDLLKHLSKQISSGYLVISDPYPEIEGEFTYYDKTQYLKPLGKIKIYTVVPSDEFTGIWKDLI